MTTGLESDQAIVPQSSLVETGPRDPSGGKDTGCIATTPEARALLAAYSTDAHRFCQVPTQAIVKDIQDAEENISGVKSVPGPVVSTVNAVGSANAAMSQLDTINSTYLQPLSAFNAVVTGIADVRFLT